jgi:hypothetical protein
MSAADAASLRFWESVADVATWAVIIGVAGEVIEILLKFLKLKFDKRRKSDPQLHPPKHIEWIERHDIGLEIFGGVFWMLVVLGLIFEWRGSHKAKDITDREARRLTQQLDAATTSAGEAKKETEQLRKANLELEKATRQLVHQYDQSTNALAEANARLASIRPIKERLVEFMKEIDPWIMSFVKAGETKFGHGSLSPYKFNKLMSLAGEPGASAYIHSVKVKEDGATRIGPSGQLFDVEWRLTHALVE